LLGPLLVMDGEQPVRIEGVKTRTVLAILLTQSNAVVSPDRLVADLWPEQPPATAVGTLHAYVSRLRRALGAGVLVTTKPGYRLSVGAEDLDVVRFNRLVAQGRTAARTGHPYRAADTLREAL